jgi:hypothetical protein
MGIMKCETHGRVAFVEACSHVGKQLDARIPPNGHRFAIMGNIFLCENCFNALGFQSFISLAELPFEEVMKVNDGRMEAFESAYERIEARRAFCIICVSELEQLSKS